MQLATTPKQELKKAKTPAQVEAKARKEARREERKAAAQVKTINKAQLLIHSAQLRDVCDAFLQNWLQWHVQKMNMEDRWRLIYADYCTCRRASLEPHSHTGSYKLIYDSLKEADFDFVEQWRTRHTDPHQNEEAVEYFIPYGDPFPYEPAYWQVDTPWGMRLTCDEQAMAYDSAYEEVLEMAE